jgi:hypothetical protein
MEISEPIPIYSSYATLKTSISVKNGLTIQSRNNSDSTIKKNEFEICYEHKFENR